MNQTGDMQRNLFPVRKYSKPWRMLLENGLKCNPT